MKHLILGTAGHVDHGKTSLIKALTGIDCDTHPEEKRRGITINLGFAHLALPSGLMMGIVDVPGHRDFVHTMVGGAAGIDMSLMVVAADSGVMPQTLEHLQIMDVLGIKKGIVAITKTDAVDADILSMARQEIQTVLENTFLEGCPIIEVSSVTGQGLDELKRTIERAAADVPERPAGSVFRMFIDRVFSVAGFGTVVTGSVMSGSLRVGDKAHVLPGIEAELRVRRLERHGQEVGVVVAGDRASINLVGLNREDVKRGMMVSDRPLRATTVADAALRLFRQAGEIELWSQELFHTGTFEAQARIHLIDRNRARGGETSLVQIHLPAPCVMQRGDRFVVRMSSGDATLGGGEIIDAFPLRHRRRPAELVAGLQKVAGGKLADLVALEARKSFCAMTHLEIANRLNVPPEEVLKALSENPPQDVVSYSSGTNVFLLARSENNRIAGRALKTLAAFHARHPLDAGGRTTEELAGTVELPTAASSLVFLETLLDHMVSAGQLKRVGHTWALSGHVPAADAAMKGRIDFVENFLENYGMQTPLISDLEIRARQHRANMQEVHHILRHLVSAGKAYFVEGQYIHGSVVNRCRSALLKALSERGSGMTVADFRDLVGGNRKICLLLLAIYDKEGVIERQGDLRILTDKGRQALSSRNADDSSRRTEG